MDGDNLAVLVNYFRSEHGPEVEQAPRPTNEYGYGELERVLSTPMGPFRIPETSVVASSAHIQRLQRGSLTVNDRYIKRITLRTLGECVIPLATGLLIGLSLGAACIILFS